MILGRRGGGGQRSWHTGVCSSAHAREGEPGLGIPIVSDETFAPFAWGGQETIQVVRRKELYEALYPETKHGGDRKGDEYQKSSPQNGDLIRPPSFVTHTTDATGRKRGTIERDVRTGKAFTPEARLTRQEAATGARGRGVGD